MGHEQDYWEGWRRFVIPKLGAIVQFLDELTRRELYVTSVSRNKEFVGAVQMGEEAFEKYLHKRGFERNPLASLKTIESTDEKEDGSWREINPDGEKEFQLHVTFYDGKKIQNSDSDTVYIYAHYEYRWDVAPIKHYKAIDMDRKRGVELMRKYLDEDGVNYKFEQP
jgi:hypothetical protein